MAFPDGCKAIAIKLYVSQKVEANKCRSSGYPGSCEYRVQQDTHRAYIIAAFAEIGYRADSQYR